jgi:hypothetical protein
VLSKCRNPYNFAGSGQLPNFGTEWLNQTATLHTLWWTLSIGWKQIAWYIPLC